MMVTAQENCPDQKGSSPLGVCRAFSHPSSYCRHGMDKDLHFYFCTHAPLCTANINDSLFIQLLTFLPCLLNIYISCSNLSGRGNPKFARVKRSIYKGLREGEERVGSWGCSLYSLYLQPTEIHGFGECTKSKLEWLQSNSSPSLLFKHSSCL